jgi:hypothetical protein
MEYTSRRCPESVGLAFAGTAGLICWVAFGFWAKVRMANLLFAHFAWRQTDGRVAKTTRALTRLSARRTLLAGHWLDPI